MTTEAKFITYKQLVQLKTCKGQRELFRKTFGESAEVTLVNCLIAVNIMTPTQRAEYDAACELLLDEYMKVRERLWEQYQDTNNLPWDKYVNKLDKAREDYTEAKIETLYSVYTSTKTDNEKEPRMNKPHKHAEVIKAWADGAEVEFLDPSESNPEWTPVKTPRWNENYLYRVRITRKYRVALWKFKDGAEFVSCENFNDKEPTCNFVGFVRYLTDWVEYEI